jgi:pimeloyl-ACP methyl ester carboxylesterase
MKFQLQSDEGLAIHGELTLPHHPRALVIVVHGFKGFMDWGFFPWVAENLCGHELAVCRFNMSRCGVGGRGDQFDRLDLFQDDTYSAQVADLRTVADYCRSQFPSLSTFLLGHSRGGGVALLGAHEISELCGVITWNAISRVDRWDEATQRQWRRDGFMDVVNARTKQIMRMSPRMLDDVEANAGRLDIGAAVERLQVPLFVVHGGRDESVPVAEADVIASRAADVSKMIIASATHTFNAIHPLVTVPPELSLAAEVAAHFCNAYA